jgi:hypothetical protein
MPLRGDRDRSPPELLARKADGGVLEVRRDGRARKAPPGERREQLQEPFSVFLNDPFPSSGLRRSVFQWVDFRRGGRSHGQKAGLL